VCSSDLMAYAALISGMLTLIATPPNLVISDELVERGFEPLGFFSFLPIGVVVLVVAIIYMLVLGRFLIKDTVTSGPPGTKPQGKSIFGFWNQFDIEERVSVLSMPMSGSELSNTISLEELQIAHNVRFLARSRFKKVGSPVVTLLSDGMELRPGDKVLSLGTPDNSSALAENTGLVDEGKFSENSKEWLPSLGGAVVLLHPEANLIGHTISDLGFRSKYGIEIVGLVRDNKPLKDFEDVPLRVGDRISIFGPWENIEALDEFNHDFVLLGLPSEHTSRVQIPQRAPVALAILAMMIVLSVLDRKSVV